MLFPDSDHPRSRGEYLLNVLYYAVFRGSSPLSRGILTPQSDLSAYKRIIPALAGNT